MADTSVHYVALFFLFNAVYSVNNKNSKTNWLFVRTWQNKKPSCWWDCWSYCFGEFWGL